MRGNPDMKRIHDKLLKWQLYGFTIPFGALKLYMDDYRNEVNTS